MELKGMFKIIQSQCVRFIHLDGISNAFLSDIATDIKDSYRFVEWPRTAADFTNPPNGLVFTMGRFGDFNIQRFVIYSDGILVEGDGTTEIMDELLDEISRKLRDKFKVDLRDMTPVRCLYSSKIEMKADPKLSITFANLAVVAESLTNSVKAYGMEIKPYELAGVTFAAELNVDGPLKPARFVFDRRIGQPLESNMFYSEAPLPTKDHITLIELLQSSL